MRTAAANLIGVDGKEVPLQGMHMKGVVTDLLFDAVMIQTYRNDEKQNIEAVYTFPLPLDAVLLGVTIKIGKRELEGCVIDKQTASEKYEEAVTDGDGAVMLETSEPGLFTMNIGNLLPGETATIRIRFGQLLNWQGDTVRFSLPTTVAPRYGDPSKAGLQPHQEVEHTLHDVAGFSVQLEAMGLLATARVESPSHRTVLEHVDGLLKISMANEQTVMDRDFVLVFRGDSIGQCAAIQDRDLDGTVVMACFQPVFPQGEGRKPTNVKIVIDCSGSMGGDSIAQAKEGVLRILSCLDERDYFSITAFGSSLKHFFDRQAQAGKENLEKASAWVKQLDANMGGTEMEKAMRACYKLKSPDGAGADVLLITDGEIYADSSFFSEAKKSKHRIFIVGVGSAIAESVVKRLAQSTGAACELVSPRENMAEKIHRHFKRMTLPKADSAVVVWPGTPKIQTPGELNVYDGDTLHAFGYFDHEVAGKVSLLINFHNGKSVIQFAEIASNNSQVSNEIGASVTARIGAATMLNGSESKDEIKTIALKYQLVSDQTNYIAVLHRADSEKSNDIPALRKVKHTMAAGWGGTGSVRFMECDIMYSMKSPSVHHVNAPAYLRKAKYDTSIENHTLDRHRNQTKEERNRAAFDNFIQTINTHFSDDRAQRWDIKIIEICRYGLNSAVAGCLLEHTCFGHTEDHVLAAFFNYLLLKHKGRMSRTVIRLITKFEKEHTASSTLMDSIEHELTDLGI